MNHFWHRRYERTGLLEFRQARDLHQAQEFYDEAHRQGIFESIPEFHLAMLDYCEVPFDPSLKLLDVACGQGLVLAQANRRVCTYGIDISIEAIKQARARTPATGLCVGQGEFLPYPDDSFDFVFCLGSLEHFLDMSQGVAELARVLKPSGRANIYVPFLNRDELIGGPLQINERYGSDAFWSKLLETQFDIQKKTTQYQTLGLPKVDCITYIVQKRTDGKRLG